VPVVFRAQPSRYVVERLARCRDVARRVAALPDERSSGCRSTPCSTSSSVHLTYEHPRVWGVTADEVARCYPCDAVLPKPAVTWFRAVTVQAPASVVFRWLCQMKVAPYSYDLLDNFGRRSPRTLTPGVERLEVGSG
jgi:hypothetical protein